MAIVYNAATGPNRSDVCYFHMLSVHMHVCSVYAHTQESTNYHFEVSPDALQGALDRFAQVSVCEAVSL